MDLGNSDLNFPNDHDFDDDLNSARGDVRGPLNIQRYTNNVLNKLSSNSLEDRLDSMEKMYGLLKEGRITLNPASFGPMVFYNLLHYYIHQIHSEEPDLKHLNYAIYLLQFPKMIDVNEIQEQYIKRCKIRINIDNVYFPYPTTVKVQSLIQPDSINFLLDGIQNPELSDNCFDLLTMISKKKNCNISFLNEQFFSFIQENPNLSYGEIIFKFFKYSLKNPSILEKNLQTLKNVFANMTNSTNKINVIFVLRSMNKIFKKKYEELFSNFQEICELLIEKLPDFLLSNSGKVITQCITFVKSLSEVPDPIIKAIFLCLPCKFKQKHVAAFKIVGQNIGRIINLMETNEIGEVLQNCFQNPQYKVKIMAFHLLVEFAESIPVINFIDIDSIFSFLDDPSMAQTVLPTIVSFVSLYEKSNKTPELLEVLSNYIEQLNELVESEDENVAQLANRLITFYESLSAKQNN